MKKKILNIIIIFIIVCSCGFTPMYSGFDANFNISILQTSGDREVNNLIITKLKKYSKKIEEKDKNFKLKINTIFEKNILSKNSAGVPMNYEIKIIAKFNIEKIDKTFNVIESFNMKSMTNRFEEKEYETIIKNNLTNSISRKLIVFLERIK